MGNTSAAESRVAAMDCDVLWVGEPTPVSNALPEHGARVERVGLDQGAQRTAAHAPDVVVLNVGTADQAVQFASALQRQHTGTTVPVVVLCDEEVADPLPAAERFGIVARLDSNAPAEDVARALQAQLRAQMDAEWQRPLSVTASDLNDWLVLAGRKGVCGLLLDGGESQAMVLGPGAATVPTPQRFCEALPAEPTSPMSFLQLPATRIRVVTRAPSDTDDADLPDVRVAIVHPDPDTRSRWQREMAAAGAEVLFDEVQPQALGRLGESAPDLLVVHEQALPELARAGCFHDAELVFSSLLVVSETCAGEISSHDLLTEAALLLSAQTRLQARIADAGLLVERLESQGPARWLRDALGYDGVVDLVVHAPQGTARMRLDYGELLEVSYRSRTPDAEALSGPAALSALRSLRFGRLIVGRPQEVREACAGARANTAPAVDEPPTEAALPGPLDVLAAYAGDRTNTAPAVEEPPAEAVEEPPAETALPGPLAAAAVELLENRAPSQDPKRPPQALAAAALAALAILGVAAWFARSDSPRQAALHSAPAPAAEPSTSPTAAATSAPARPAAPPVAPNSSGVTEPTADAEPPATEPTADAEPSVAEPAAKAANSADEPPQPTGSATATASGAAKPSPARDRAHPANVSLPSRLRRWTEPTPAQQLIIDAFWARVNKDFAAAERLLAQAREMNPKNAEGAYQLALTHARQGKLDEALHWAERAMQLSPADPAPLSLQGDLYTIRGQRQKARAVWEECLRVLPGYSSCVRRLERLESR